MWHSGIWLSGGLGGAGLTLGFDEVKCLFWSVWSYDPTSAIKQEMCMKNCFSEVAAQSG